MDVTVLSCSFMQMLAGSGACSRAVVSCTSPRCRCPPHGASVSSHANGSCHVYLQLSAMDVSVRTTMKGAAKCDKHCDLQNSVNQQGFERILRFRDTPESMPASASALLSCSRWALQPWASELAMSVARVCAPRCLVWPLMHSARLRSLMRTQLSASSCWCRFARGVCTQSLGRLGLGHSP